MLLAACDSPSSQPAAAVDPAAISDTIRTVVKAFVDGWSKISCENQDAVLRFYDLSDPGFIDGNETSVVLFPGDSLPRTIKAFACQESESATLDSLLVRVLAPDVATASWTYHTTYRSTAGASRSVRGTVLQVFKRSPAPWRFPVAMSTHVPISPP